MLAAIFRVDTIKYYSIPSVPSRLEGVKTRPLMGFVLGFRRTKDGYQLQYIYAHCKELAYGIIIIQVGGRGTKFTTQP